MTYTFSAIIEREDRWFVALCPELDVASQGKTTDEALKNLKEAIQLYLENASKSELRGVARSHPLITTLEVSA